MSKKEKAVKKPAKVRRMPKRLSQLLYCYVEPTVAEHAKGYGKKAFGSFSAYVDALLAADQKAIESKKERLVIPPVKAPQKKAA